MAVTVTKSGGIIIKISGDNAQLLASLREAQKISKEMGKSISDTLGASLSPSQAAKQADSLNKYLVNAAASAKAAKVDLSSLEAEFVKMGRAIGVTERGLANYVNMQKKMYAAQAGNSLENNLRGIQRLTASTTMDMARFRRSIGDNAGAFREMGRAAAESFGKIVNLRNAAIVGAVGYGLKSTGETAMQFDTYQRSFNAISGSPAGGAEEMEFVRQEADRLGQSLFALMDSYRGLSAAAQTSGLSQSQIRDVFSSVGEAATVLGLSSDQTKYALYALQQMMSKGVVSMEELRRQLGDQLPGAFSAAARAMGVTEAELIKLVESGQLMSRDFLPKFAAELRNTFGAGFAEAAKSARSDFNRFATAWTESKGLFGAGFLDEAADGAKKLTATMKISADEIAAAGKVIGDVFSVVASVAGVVTSGVEMSTLGLATMIDTAIARFSLISNMDWFGGDNTEAIAAYQREIANIDQTFKELSDEIENRFKISIGDADAVTAALGGTAMAAAGAVNTLNASMGAASATGFSAQMQDAISFLDKFTAASKGAQEEAAAASRGKAETALMNIASQAAAALDEGDLIKYGEYVDQYEKYDKRIKEIEANAAKASTSYKSLGGASSSRSGGRSRNPVEEAAREAEKMAREAEKQQRDMISGLQERLTFYENLKEVMPQAGAEYDKIRVQLAALQDQEYSALGISQQFIDKFREWEDLRNAADAVSGLRVAMQDYIGGMTDAKVAADVFGLATDNVADMLVDTLTFSKSAGQAFGDMATAMVNSLSRIAVEMLVIKPIVSGLAEAFDNLAARGGGGGGIWGSLGSAIAGMFGGGASAGVGADFWSSQASWGAGLLASAKGNVFNAEGLHQHVNSVVSRPTIFPFARGAGLMGEAGPEAIMPLRRGSDGRLGVAASGEGGPPTSISINIINQSGHELSGESGPVQQDSGGALSMDLIVKGVEGKIRGNMARGTSAVGRGVEEQYGLGSSKAMRKLRRG